MPLAASALLVTATAAGFIAGLFGASGGVIAVPALRFLADALGWPPDQTRHPPVANADGGGSAHGALVGTCAPAAGHRRA